MKPIFLVCNKKIVSLAILMVPLLLCGCWPGADLIGAYEKDVSNRQDLWGGYTKGQRYILLHDVFLRKEDLGFKYRIYAGVPLQELVRGNCFLLYCAPETIEAYAESPDRWPLIIGIIKSGTEIECTKVLGWGTLMWPMSHAVYATIIDGPYAGKLIDISDLSCTRDDCKGNYVSYPNPRLLKETESDCLLVTDPEP